MAMEILKSFGTLQSELEQARNSLKGVDENIKRLIGRDPSTIVRPIGGGGSGGVGGNKRNIQQQQTNNDETRNNRNVRCYLSGNVGNDEQQQPPPSKRRNNSSVFKRLSDKLTFNYDDELQQQSNNKQMISKVIVTPKEVPSRQEALAAQNNDEKFKARNRRMFGALLGTLQKFQQEETKLKSKEEKRAQVEKRIEEHEIREKAEIKKERQELFLNRKKKQAEIKMIELKMLRMKEYSTWEERQRPRQHFIHTKAKPNIYYLPRKLNDSNREALENSKKDIEKMIDKRRQEIFDELQHIEDRMKKNFERKPAKENEDEEDKETMIDEEEEQQQERRTNEEGVFNIKVEEVVQETLLQEVAANNDKKETNQNKNLTKLNNKSLETSNRDLATTLDKCLEMTIKSEKSSTKTETKSVVEEVQENRMDVVEEEEEKQTEKDDCRRSKASENRDEINDVCAKIDDKNETNEDEKV